jgi:hypothetical protein
MAENQIKEITTADGTTYPVADLPEQLQNLVRFYERANFNLREAEADFVVAKAATNALGAEITASVEKYTAELAAAAETPVVVDSEVVAE